MKRASLLPVVAVALASMFAGSQFSTESVRAQEETAKKQEAPAKKLTGRVPQYYSKAGISDAQRKEIYKLQAEFNPKIAELQKQIVALTEERDEKVESVLTPEQLAMVKKFREDAAKRRGSKKTKPASN